MSHSSERCRHWQESNEQGKTIMVSTTHPSKPGHHAKGNAGPPENPPASRKQQPPLQQTVWVISPSCSQNKPLADTQAQPRDKAAIKPAVVRQL